MTKEELRRKVEDIHQLKWTEQEVKEAGCVMAAFVANEHHGMAVFCERLAVVDNGVQLSNVLVQNSRERSNRVTIFNPSIIRVNDDDNFYRELEDYKTVSIEQTIKDNAHLVDNRPGSAAYTGERVN